MSFEDEVLPAYIRIHYQCQTDYGYNSGTWDIDPHDVDWISACCVDRMKQFNDFHAKCTLPLSKNCKNKWRKLRSYGFVDKDMDKERLTHYTSILMNKK